MTTTTTHTSAGAARANREREGGGSDVELDEGPIETDEPRRPGGERPATKTEKEKSEWKI